MPKVTRDTNTTKKTRNKLIGCTNLSDAVIAMANNPETKFENIGIKRGINALVCGYTLTLATKAALNFLAKNDPKGFAAFVKMSNGRLEHTMSSKLETWIADAKNSIRHSRVESFEARKYEFLNSAERTRCSGCSTGTKNVKLFGNL